MDRQAPQTHRSTTATDTPQDARPVQLHAALSARQTSSAETQHVADGSMDYAAELASYAWPQQAATAALAHFTLMSDGTVRDNRTGESYTLQPATEGDAAAVPVEVRMEDLLGDTTDTHATITAEAEAIVYGSRNGDYGHPREDFTRCAIIWTGLLHHRLADGEHITPEDVARLQIGLKLSRDVHSHKRDNRVDIAGYALALDRLETGR